MCCTVNRSTLALILPAPKRNLRRNPPRGKTAESRAIRGTVESLTPEDELLIKEYRPREPPEEERRMVSSDLEDCPEIWQPELGNYVLDTHKRMRQIDAYFNRWIIVRPLLDTS